jgi:DNA processing protein
MPTAVLTQEETLHWIALRLVPGLGPRTAVPLIRQFGSPVSIFRASRSELMGAGLRGGVAQSISSGCTFEDALDQQRLLEKAGAELIPFSDPRYPDMLRNIFDPPIMLFVRGRIELLECATLGVVGTRRPTAYGIAASERLSYDLAAQGLVIASGMARGIDTAAHKAALEAGGDTIAVFGSGIDHIYPAENRKLAEQIAERGLLLSEYPMSSPAHPQNFPSRNRIVSGISFGVLVVEGAQYSGSAITARLAMEQGREVFCVPGNITSKMSWGPNLLIKQGAKLVQAAEDILTELPVEARRRLADQRGVPEAGAGDEVDSPQQQLARLQLHFGPNTRIAQDLLAAIRPDESVHVDALAEKLENCSSSELIAVLFELEMLGLVRQLPGRNFVKVW